MKKLKFSSIITLFILIFLFFPSTTFSDDNFFEWQIGEELTYKVKWSFIRLGTLKLQVVDTLTINNTFVYHIKLFIDSNPLIFFVNMHSVYESFIDDKFRLNLFLADEEIDNVTYKTEYRFNYVDSLIHINMTDVNDPTKTIVRDDTLNETILDGTTMIFYARANVAYTKSDTITSFFEAKRGKVVINFKGKNGKIKISALQSPMETFYLDGIIHMKGIAGLTGPFKGWFALDEQRPPLKAELKVFIGHVKVELEDWKKWSPKLIEIQN